VGMDNSLTAVETTIKRLTKGLERMGDFVTVRKKEEAEHLSEELFPLTVEVENAVEVARPELSGFDLFADSNSLRSAARGKTAGEWRTLLQDSLQSR